MKAEALKRRVLSSSVLFRPASHDRIVSELAVVKSLLAHHDLSKPIAFVGHGGVGTLLRCHLAGLPIARSHDQPPNGGGNVHGFRLGDLKPLSGWVPVEEWQAVQEKIGV